MERPLPGCLAAAVPAAVPGRHSYVPPSRWGSLAQASSVAAALRCAARRLRPSSEGDSGVPYGGEIW